MNKNDKIQNALSKLDAGNDNHWTAEGAPRLETLRMLAGDPSISRDDVNTVDQGFTRQSLMAKKTDTPSQAAPVETPTPPVETTVSSPELTPTPEPNQSVAKIIEGMPQTQFNALGQITSDLGSDLKSELAEIDADGSLDAQISRGEQTIAEIDAELARLHAHKARCQSMLEILNSRKLSLQPPEHLLVQSEISAYLATQRARREAVAQEMGKLGLRSLPLSNRSILDQRLSQKSRR